jgi:hypothetical protein
MNDIRGFDFRYNVVRSTGPWYVQELPQRNSQDVIIISNTFDVSAAGFGEYGAHWILADNVFSLHLTAPTQGAGLAMGGLDVLFIYNSVQGSTRGVAPLVMDFLGLDRDIPYVGKIRLFNNLIDCGASGANCLKIVATDTNVDSNQFTLIGSGQVILVEGPMPQAVQIQNNTINVQNGLGIVLGAHDAGESTIRCNTVTGTGPIGIYVASQAMPNRGRYILSGNKVKGFATAIVMDPTKRAGTVINPVSANCPGQ